MANANGSIDEIIGEEARKQIDDATAKMGTLLTTFKESVTAVNLMNDALNKAGSGGSGGLKKATNEFAEFEKVEKKLIETTRQYGTEINNLKVLTTQAAAQNKAQAQSTVALKGSYNELQANMSLLIAKYKALSAEMRSGAIGKGLQADIAMANKSLKDLDSGLGNMQRNVGNYGSALTKIWGGVRQLAYILPGLGIAGIFNLAGEAITKLFPQIEEFYNKIVNGNAEAIKAAKELSEDIGKQTGKFETLTRQLNNHNVSKKEQLQAAKDLQELYPTALKNYSAEEIAAGKAAAAIDLIGKALIAVSKAKAGQAEMDKLSSEQWANEDKKMSAQASLLLLQSQAATTKALIDKNIKSGSANISVTGLGLSLSDLENKIAEQKNIILEANRLNNDLERQMNKTAERIGSLTETTRAGGLKIDGSDISKGVPKDKKEIKEIEIHVKWIEDNLPSTGLSPATVKALGDAYKGMFESINDDIAAEYPQGLGDPEAAQLNLQLSERANQKRIEADKNKIAEEGNKVRIQKNKEMLDAIVQITNDATSALSAISDAITERELLAIDKRDKALAESYKNELRWIEDSGFSSAEKEKKKAKLAADTESKQKQIDRDRVTALRKQAVLNKALSIVNIIAKTAEAVMANLSIPVYGQIMAAVVAAAGAAELAKVIATPLPQYAKGRKGGKAEHAIVGEIGQEAIVTTDGKVTLTPSTPSLAYIPQGADVIPHNELIKNSAYVALARQGTVTTDKLQMALIAEFEKNTEKIDELINVTKSKNLTATYNGLGGFESYKQANIR